MSEKTDVRQGTLALMILKTLETLGPLHGYGIARRIEQTSGGRLSLNYGTVYPALLKLEPEGFIASEWGSSENNRKAKYYKLTRAGRAQVKKRSANGRKRRRLCRVFSLLGNNRDENVAFHSVAPGRPISASPARTRLERGIRLAPGNADRRQQTCGDE